MPSELVAAIICLKMSRDLGVSAKAALRGTICLAFRFEVKDREGTIAWEFCTIDTLRW